MKGLILVIGFVVCGNLLAQTIYEKKRNKVCIKDENGKRRSDYFSEIKELDTTNHIYYFFTKQNSGLLNGTGKVLFQGKYDGFALVKAGVYAGHPTWDSGNTWIVVDKNGDHLKNYEENLIEVDWSSGQVSLLKKKDSLIAVFNSNNQPITEFNYSAVDFFAGEDGAIGIIKKVGEEKFRYFYVDGRLSEEFYE